MKYSQKALQELKDRVDQTVDELNDLIEKHPSGCNMSEMGQINNFFLGAINARLVYLDARLANLEDRLDCLFPKSPP